MLITVDWEADGELESIEHEVNWIKEQGLKEPGAVYLHNTVAPKSDQCVEVLHGGKFFVS